MGRKRERDWGSGSQTSIGPHSRAVGAQFRNVARARERRLSYSRPERRRICTCTSPGGSSLRRSWRGGACRPGRGRAAERWRGMNERGRCSTSVTCLCYVPQKHQLASQCTVTFLPLNNGSPATRQCSAPAFLRPRNSLAFQLTDQEV